MWSGRCGGVWGGVGGWDERDVEVVRLVPEQDGVDWVRQCVNGTGIGPRWEDKRRMLTMQEFERGE